MRMAGLPVKKMQGWGNDHQEKEIERWRSVPMGEAGRFSQTTRQRLKFPAVKSAARDLTRLQDMGLDA
jgi:hypothetical protein